MRHLIGDKVRRICDPANDSYYKLQLDRAYYITEVRAFRHPDQGTEPMRIVVDDVQV
jgi:hypothetical protein